MRTLHEPYPQVSAARRRRRCDSANPTLRMVDYQRYVQESYHHRKLDIRNRPTTRAEARRARHIGNQRYQRGRRHRERTDDTKATTAAEFERFGRAECGDSRLATRQHMDVSDYAARFCGGSVCFVHAVRRDASTRTPAESAARLRYQQCGFLLAGRAILASGAGETGRFELPERLLRHCGGKRVRDHSSDWSGSCARAALVRDLHVARRACRAAVLLLADHAVVVRDPRIVPVVLGSDVLDDHPIHGVESCDGYGAGYSPWQTRFAHLLPSEL